MFSPSTDTTANVSEASKTFLTIISNMFDFNGTDDLEKYVPDWLEGVKFVINSIGIQNVPDWVKEGHHIFAEPLLMMKKIQFRPQQVQ